MIFQKPRRVNKEKGSFKYNSSLIQSCHNFFLLMFDCENITYSGKLCSELPYTHHLDSVIIIFYVFFATYLFLHPPTLMFNACQIKLWTSVHFTSRHFSKYMKMPHRCL